MAQKKILFYVDSAATLKHCVTASEILRQTISARIIMMIVDSEKVLDRPLKNYEIYDYSALLRPGEPFRPVWNPASGASEPRAFQPSLKSRIRERLGPRRLAETLHEMSETIKQRSERPSQSGRFGIAIRSLGPRGRQLRRHPLVVRSATLGSRFGFRPVYHRLRSLRPKTSGLVPRIRAGAVVLDATARRMVFLPIVWTLNAAESGVRAVDQVTRRRRNWIRSTLLWQSTERLRYWLTAVRGVRRFVLAIAPDAIVLPEDNIETMSRVFVAVGRTQGIPSLILPVTIPNPLEPAQFYYDSPLHQGSGASARLLSTYREKWRYVHRGRALLRLPVQKAVAVELLGFSTPAPWILNRGDANAIAVDSDVQRDLYCRLGFPPHQLKVVGDVNGAVLFKGVRDRENLLTALLQRHGLSPGRPLIVCAFPPDQYHGTSTAEFEFPSFDAMVGAWMESFTRLGTRANVLIRPHPRLTPERLAKYETGNIKITTQSTAELIPLCDLYAAAISATIRWAIACGIPVVNYDTFRYRYGDYTSAAGVVHVETVSDFRSTIDRFISDPAYAADIAHRQRGVMRHWGLVDDGFAQRLGNLASELMGEVATR